MSQYSSAEFILIESPGWNDAEFYGNWLLAAARAQRGAPDTDSGAGFREFVELNVEAEVLGYASTFVVEQAGWSANRARSLSRCFSGDCPALPDRDGERHAQPCDVAHFPCRLDREVVGHDGGACGPHETVEAMNEPGPIETVEAVSRVAPDFSGDLIDRPRPLLVPIAQTSKDCRIDLAVFLSRGQCTLVLHGKVPPFRATAPGQSPLSPGPTL